ncbi:PAS domain S-box protein [Okeania sp.]|uniref:PAS domain-containing sensor histidine kinase n=1 Tax=Okeania sp. TaxID=3100323 RepID=UPI002B4B7F2C|nr:PAS domain S-box protein [Okeania sp.]MEB3342030.1 PAS domain S-box protein [Okeania sp.]
MFQYIPHGHCYLWNHGLVSLHLISDTLIAIAYYSIPLMLIYFIRQREDLPFLSIFWLFSWFIIACGTTHIMEVWTLWNPTYWVSGIIKAITAIISVLTAFELFPIIPQALAMPTPAQLEIANQQLQRQITERQKIENELRQSEQRYRAVIEDQTECIARFQTDGTLTLVNDTFCRYFDKEKAELIGQVYQPLIFPPDREKIDSLLASLNPENPVGEVENRVFVGEQVRWMQWINRGIYNTEGELIEFQAVGRDISDRIAAEEALKKSEARFRAASEASLDSFFILESLRDETGKIIDFTFVDINSPTEKLISLTKSEVLGQRLCKIFPIYCRESFCQKYIQVVETGEVLSEEFATDSFGNDIKWLQHTVVPLEDGVAVTTRDISQRKQLEISKLAEREELFRQAFENAPIGMALVSPEGNLIRVNHALCQIAGYDETELMRLSLTKIVHPQNILAILASCQEVIDNKRNFSKMEKQYIHKQGQIIWAIVSISAAYSILGVPLHLIVQVQDISQRKRYEMQQKNLITKLKNSNRELQDFAYVASHDLQEPLRKIQAFGDRLKLKYAEALDEKGRDYLERMQNAAHRMQTLIRDLLDFSRVGTKAEEFISVSLSQIVAEVLSDLETTIEKTKARVEVGDLPMIHADPTQMRQLLQNLISNAIKFHLPEQSPFVKVEAKLILETAQAEIKVSDNGIGFEEKYLDRIFAPFQRLHGRQEYEGTGMGLAICRKIVERHQGSITAHSSLGQGTTFIITLPLKQ